MPTLRMVFSAASFLGDLRRLEAKLGPAAVNPRMTAAHEHMAGVYTDAMIDHLVAKIEQNGRRQREDGDPRDGRLALALAAPQNRPANPTGFGVGVEEWLNSSPAAKYWRQIEQGNPKVYQWSGWFYEPGGPHLASEDMRGQHERFGQTAQSRRSKPVSVGPFPAYRYFAAGAAAFRRLDKRAVYERFLGINLDDK